MSVFIESWKTPTRFFLNSFRILLISSIRLYMYLLRYVIFYFFIVKHFIHPYPMVITFGLSRFSRRDKSMAHTIFFYITEAELVELLGSASSTLWLSLYFYAVPTWVSFKIWMKIRDIFEFYIDNGTSESLHSIPYLVRRFLLKDQRCRTKWVLLELDIFSYTPS